MGTTHSQAGSEVAAGPDVPQAASRAGTGNMMAPGSLETPATAELQRGYHSPDPGIQVWGP